MDNLFRLKNKREEKLSESQKKIQEVFLASRELREIGNEKDYQKYIESIFPESKIKDVVYHGGTMNPEDRGMDSFTGEFGGKHGLYFTGSESRAKSYTKAATKEYENKSKIFPVRLNITKPLDSKIWSKWKYGLDRITDKEYEIIKEHGADGLIEKDFLSHFTQYLTQYAVLEPAQIHVLGSEADIEKFKEFVAEKTT